MARPSIIVWQTKLGDVTINKFNGSNTSFMIFTIFSALGKYSVEDDKRRKFRLHNNRLSLEPCWCIGQI